MSTPSRPDPFPAVKGRCPSCRSSSSLFLGAGGYVTCARLDCPRPDLASEWLSPIGQDLAAKRGAERDQLMYELIRQEHDALRWENPHEPPEWTTRMRARLELPWVPDCEQCAAAPARFCRDVRRWPRLYGWTPAEEDENEAAALTA